MAYCYHCREYVNLMDEDWGPLNTGFCSVEHRNTFFEMRPYLIRDILDEMCKMRIN